MRQKLFLPIFLLACAAATFSLVQYKLAHTTPRLPGARPDDIIITTYLSPGGMVPGGGSFQIITHLSADESSITLAGVGEVPDVKKFNLSSTELDAVYGLLKENHFDDMTMDKTITNDGGSSQITITWGDYTVQKGTDGTGRISPRWEKNFDAIIAGIGDIASRKSQDFKELK